MIDLNNVKSRDGLRKAMKSSWEELEPFRKFRRDAIKLYASTEYGKKKTEDDLINLLGLTATTYSVILASNRPRANVSTPSFELKGFAKFFETGLNNLVKEIRFEDTLRRIVLDAFFLMGVAKIYWAESGHVIPTQSGEQYDAAEAMGGSVWVDPGKIYVERISMDDYGYDTAASSVDRCRFFFHRYRIPFDAAMTDERFDPAVLAKLGPTSKYGSGFMGREYAGDKTNNMTTNIDHDDVEPMIDLLDVYLPMENKWCVMSMDDSLPPLLCEDWRGPEGGPFKHLFFDEVPDNVMPVSPAHSLKRMHQLMNSIARKMANQARRQKDITVYAGDQQDVSTARNAQDGDWVKVQHPELINVLKYGGADQMSGAFLTMFDGLFNRQAGNLDAMAGLGPQSETAKQDQLLAGAVSRKETKMKNSVVAFVQDIYRSIGWMMFADQNLVVKGDMTVPGLMYPVDATWSPELREGDIADYNLEVDVYSMAWMSPQEQYQALKEGMMTIGPLLPLAGGMIDPVKLTITISKMLNCPALMEVVTFPMNPMAMMEMQAANPPQGQMPIPGQQEQPNGGEYIHRSVGGSNSPDGARVQMAQGFMANAQQQGMQSGVQKGM